MSDTYLEEKNRLVNKEGELTVPYILIKSSISLLLIKVILIQILYGLVLIGIYVPLYISNVHESFLNFLPIRPFIFFFVIFSQIVSTITVVITWLFETYKITPTEIIHTKGVVFEKVEHYAFWHVMTVDIQQSFTGKILDFGTIHMYDRYVDSHIYLYQIHNPLRHFELLVKLIPYSDENEELIENPFHKKETTPMKTHQTVFPPSIHMHRLSS